MNRLYHRENKGQGLRDRSQNPFFLLADNQLIKW